MRKTSQDGGDSTSITSGFENEYKRISSGIMKSTRNSLKKRVHSLSHESDDAVIEPLLQRDKEKDKVEISTQSAKYLLSKTKTEQRDKERDVELNSKVSQTLITGARDRPDPAVGNGVKDILPKSTATTVVHPSTYSSSCPNYSNGLISNDTALPKSLIAKEVKGDKTIGLSTGPLIFTTAKIHADGKTKNLEPLQVTVGSISSIIETNKTPSLASIEKVQDITVMQDNDSKKSCVVKAVTTDIKLYNQSTVTPDIVASATASQPSVSYKKQNTTTTGMSTSPTREKLAKLEAYLAMKESKEENGKGVNKTVTPVEVKSFHTGAVIVKGSKDVKDTVQQFKDSSCEPKDSNDTTIKIDPFVIGKKLDNTDITGRKKCNLAGKAVSHDMATKDIADKVPINKIDSHITTANKNVTKPTHTPGVIDDKKALKEMSSTSSSSKGLNKVESIKQLQRQKKSTLDDSETDGIVKPKHVSALPTPTSATSSKTLPKTEPGAKRESDSDKANKANKTSGVVAKDAKDNTKTQKASETSLIPTKTTKVNVSATPKPTTTVKTSVASAAKPSSSNTAPGPPSSNAKPVPKSTTSATPCTTISVASTAKSSVKSTEQKIKDLSKDGKPPKA